MEVLLLLCTLRCHFVFILKQKNVIAKKKKAQFYTMSCGEIVPSII
jgi:hypothetical protein